MSWPIVQGKPEKGLSRRDILAGMALQGLLANHRSTPLTSYVECAREYADALIAELDKPKEKN